MGGLMKIMITPSIDPEHYAKAHDIPKLTGALLAVDSRKWLSSHDTQQESLANVAIHPAL
jgi:hypothetical protein